MRMFVSARLRGAGLLAAGLIVFSGAAGAQQPDPQPPLGAEYCIYEQLAATFDYEVVAEAYLADAPDDEDMIAALKDAADTCAAQHGMNEEQKATASEVGIYGATADYLAEELLFAGVDEDVVDSLFGLVDEISDADLDIMFAADWRKNAAFVDRLKAAVLSKGVPDDSVSVENAMQVVELSAFAMDAVIGYMIASEEDAS